MPKPKLLLHVCCAPCSGFLSQVLSKKFDITVYYDNPNIWPETEFIKRAQEAEKFFQSVGINFILVDWDHSEWQQLVRGLAAEPEKGKRCRLCYLYRLEKTAAFAQENGFAVFGTSLTISPHKDAEAIISLGQSLAKEYGIEFLAEDFKKNDGFKNAMAFSCAQGFYRQNYCGCEYSKKNDIIYNKTNHK